MCIYLYHVRDYFKLLIEQIFINFFIKNEIDISTHGGLKTWGAGRKKVCMGEEVGPSPIC